MDIKWHLNKMMHTLWLKNIKHVFLGIYAQLLFNGKGSTKYRQVAKQNKHEESLIFSHIQVTTPHACSDSRIWLTDKQFDTTIGAKRNHKIYVTVEENNSQKKKTSYLLVFIHWSQEIPQQNIIANKLRKYKKDGNKF